MTSLSTEVDRAKLFFALHVGVQNPHFGLANAINGAQGSVCLKLNKQVVGPVEWKPNARSNASAQTRSADQSQCGAGESPWLTDALREVEEIDQAVEEDNLPEIESKTKMNVESLLRAIARKGVATVPIVYPTESGEVAVYFHSRLAACAILIEVGNDGRGSFVCVTDEHDGHCADNCDATFLPRHTLLRKCLDKLSLDL